MRAVPADPNLKNGAAEQNLKLAGPGVYGPPQDRNAAVAVLRQAIASGVNHIDTSDFYGPHVTNQIIKEALHPYPEGLVIVTKVGARRGQDKSWNPDFSRQGLTDAVHDNLRNLCLDVLDVVNLRVMSKTHGPSEGSIAEPFTVLAELRDKGLIRHLGLSNVTPAQWREALTIAPVVGIQNMYNLAHRDDEDLSTSSRIRVLLTCRFFRWEASILFNRRLLTPLPYRWVRRPCKSLKPGFCNVHPISCSFLAPLRWSICERI